ncbi:MAG: hypothetical protein Q9191_008149, partial [Dirinaria sp. TL-2023a]
SHPVSLRTQNSTKDAGSADASSDEVPATRLRSPKSLETLNATSNKDEVRSTGPRGADPQIAWTLLSGLPSPSSPFWTATTIFLNVVAAILTADTIYRAPYLHPSHDLAFARVGFVSDTSARILVREPNTAQLPLYISYRGVQTEFAPRVDNSWKSAGHVYWLSDDTDFTYTLSIAKLRPSSRYQYAVSNNHTGFFTTAPPSGETWPGTEKMTFLTSSCIKPRFPYNPLAHPLSIPGFKHLAKQLPSLRASFMLFLGDFIYIDVPRRLGYDRETYRREYRQVYASPDWASVSTELPWLHVLDDHEIANDWDGNTTAPYPAAVDPWHIYHTSINPPPPPPNASYFTFTHGPATFFLLDTRRYRSPSFTHPASSPQKTMLGAAQLSSLLTFLRTPAPAGVKWKFVISSIPFTRNWRFGSSDTWAAYLHERQLILEAMWSAPAGAGIVILSGDRHEFAATAFPSPHDNGSTKVHEFSTSPLSMFYLPVRTYSEREGEGEVCLKYVPDGNSKFGVVDVEGASRDGHGGGAGQGVLRFRLFVDGVESWRYVLTTPEGGHAGDAGGGARGREAIWG